MQRDLFCLFYMGSSFWTAFASDGLVLSPSGVNIEVSALMSVKRTMEDTSGVMRGWDSDSVDPCTWNMVGCSEQGFVISLEMANMELSGILPPTIGNLSHLQKLLFQNNRLYGSIPNEVCELGDLRMLDLSGNQFSGSIPSCLGMLTSLGYLKLSKNRLSGKIPDSIASRSGLLFLDLSYNNLTGPTPLIRAKDYSVSGNADLCSPSSSHLCEGSSKPKINPTQNHGYGNKIIALAGGIPCVVVLILLTVFFVHLCKNRVLSNSHVSGVDIGNMRRLSYKEIRIATGNFSERNILGRGGFGVVYKGCLPDKKLIAVKRLKDPGNTGETQFQTEVEIISLASHRNLLPLYGFCMTKEERLLVYPYMENGSLADWLREIRHERAYLDWRRRVRIAYGIARGLVYLHEMTIIHRDVKAANVLLDEAMEAVVGDFGLAKVAGEAEAHVTREVRGTAGHMAPEYLLTGRWSEKSDVYGFGVLLAELASGGRSLDWVRGIWEDGRVSEVANDVGWESDDVAVIVELALRCTSAEPSVRPTMLEVLKVIESLADDVDLRGEGEWSNTRLSVADEESLFIIEAMELSGPR